MKTYHTFINRRAAFRGQLTDYCLQPAISAQGFRKTECKINMVISRFCTRISELLIAMCEVLQGEARLRARGGDGR